MKGKRKFAFKSFPEGKDYARKREREDMIDFVAVHH